MNKIIFWNAEHLSPQAAERAEAAAQAARAASQGKRHATLSSTKEKPTRATTRGSIRKVIVAQMANGPASRRTPFGLFGDLNAEPPAYEASLLGGVSILKPQGPQRWGSTNPEQIPSCRNSEENLHRSTRRTRRGGKNRQGRLI